jgi:hypothetical protein
MVDVLMLMGLANATITMILIRLIVSAFVWMVGAMMRVPRWVKMVLTLLTLFWGYGLVVAAVIYMILMGMKKKW